MLRTTPSALAARFVDERLRMEEHPGIVFRKGPTGVRAAVEGGPDVWEIIREIKVLMGAREMSGEGDAAGQIAERFGLTARQVDVAIGYWSEWRDEVDAWIDSADEAEEQAYERWKRTRELLAPRS